MYKFYCGFEKKKCKNSILLFTDTDSLCFETEEHFYEIMLNNKEFFDLSYFPKDSKYFCDDNRKLPGKMNDEYGGIAKWIFVGTKSKIYSILDVNNCEKRIYKGHNFSTRNDEFMDVLFNKKVIRHITKRIKSFGHTMYTYESNKTSLSAFDDK